MAEQQSTLEFCLRPVWEETNVPLHNRVVARSENLGEGGGLVVLGGDNVLPLVEIGLNDPPKTGEGALATALHKKS